MGDWHITFYDQSSKIERPMPSFGNDTHRGAEECKVIRPVEATMYNCIYMQTVYKLSLRNGSDL